MSEAPWAFADRLVLAEVEAKVLGRVQHPITIGRYRVERAIGAGGMGRILLAHDDRLQRKVALKLVSPHLADEPAARARIVREARAMAKLSDPHVAQVYEVADADSRLYVAMEYVDGSDLRAWLDERPRAWTEILRVFLQAGRGLAAAHDKGLVHRDFKPDNVVLDREGRARVVDFGLARIDASLSRERGSDLYSAAAIEMTAAGAVVGTPAYMAPEQWDGATVDARSDQFSFCVALYEALAGARPFPGDSIAQIQAAIAKGVVAPLSRPIPRVIGRALRRGLARDPAARWPDMHRLLAALDPARRRRRILLGLGALTIVTLAALAVRPMSDRCAAAAAPIERAYDPGTRNALDTALRELDMPWAHATADLVLPRLDAHATAWAQAARAVCSAEAEAIGPARGCLDAALARLQTMIEGLMTGDPAVVVNAAADAELLADPRACLEAPNIPAFASDRTPAQRQAEAFARTEIAKAERSLGIWSTPGSDFAAQLAHGRDAAAAAVAASRTAEHASLAAHAAWIEGRLRSREGEKPQAEASFRRAIELGHECGDAAIVAAATIDLVYVVGNDRERTSEAHDLAAQSEAMLAALGDPPMLGARLLSHRATTLARARKTDHAQAIALHEAAIERLRGAVGPAHPDVIGATVNLGSALQYANRLDEAEARLTDARVAATAQWGEDHPRTATLITALGLTRLSQGDLDAALADLQHALSIRERTLGEDHDEVASARFNLAKVLRRLDRHAQAIEQLRRGLQIRIERLGENDHAHALWLLPLGESELSLGNVDAARDALQRAQRVLETTGAQPAELARVRFVLAQTHRDTDPATARVLATMARTAYDSEDQTGERTKIDTFLATLPR